VCDVFKHQIRGATTWRFVGERCNMYQREHEALFRSIRQGKPIDDSKHMCQSTMMGLMGRMAAYTGQEITWEQAMNSQEVLRPKNWEKGEVPVAEVAMPGITKFG
jgi:hypothetical protein